MTINKHLVLINRPVTRKFFLRTLWSYMIIVALSALLVLFIMGYVRTQVQNERLQTEKQDLISSMDSLSLQLDTIINQCFSLSTQKGFDMLRLINGPIPLNKHICLGYAKDSLHSFCGSNSLIEDIIVSFFDCPAVITSQYAFVSHEDFDRFYSLVNLEVSLSRVTKGVCTTWTVHFFPETALFLPSMSRGVQVIPMVVPLTSKGQLMNNVGCVVVLLRSREIQSMLFFFFFEQAGTVCSLKDNNSVLWSSNANAGKTLPFVNLEYRGTYLTVSASIPQYSLYRYTQPVIKILMRYSLLALGIGALVAFWASALATKPMYDLLDTIGGTSGYEKDKTAHQVILQTLDEMMENNRHLLQINRESELEQSYQKLERLLFGFGKKEDFSSPIPPQGALCYGMHQPLDSRAVPAMPAILYNYIRRKLPEGFIFHQLTHDSFLVLVPCTNEYDRVKISDLLRGLFDECASLFSVDISGVLGNIYSSPEEMSTSFEDIKLTYHAFHEQFPESKLSIITHRSQRHTLNLSTQSELFHLLVAGKTAQVHTLIEQFFVDFQDGQYGLEQLYYAVRMVLLLAREQLSFDLQIPHYYPNSTPNENIHTLITAADSICQFVCSSKRSHNELLLQRILETIEIEYTDSEFYNTALAERVGISEKYLCSFVKEQTGRTVTDLIQSKRIEKAYHLLIHSEKPVNDIWQSCGFATYNTFYKTIRRIYGMSPLELRTQNETKPNI